jgi:hypothetical protein
MKATRQIGALAFAVIAATANAQPHETRRGELTLRASTVASGMIDPATAKRHGIERASDVGVLNVLVARSRGGVLHPVPAQVEAEAWSLSGVRQKIQMREVREEDRVTYLGSYDFLPREVIDFRISAVPLGQPATPALSLTFRDRVWPR